LNFRDAFAEANPGKPGYTSGPPNPYKETDSTPKRIDYIFLLPGDRHDIHIESCEVTMDQPVGGKVLSDHYGVKARLSIRARAQ
jgi:endonuclease/exonuclease/phosphatase family metal-dependent hydrolase